MAIWDPQPDFNVPNIKLHPSTVTALAGMGPEENRFPDVRVYTDGSYDPVMGVDSYAMVAVA